MNTPESLTPSRRRSFNASVLQDRLFEPVRGIMMTGEGDGYRPVGPAPTPRADTAFPASGQPDHPYRMIFDSLAEGLAVVEAHFDADGAIDDYTIVDTNASLRTMLDFGVARAEGLRLSQTRYGGPAWMELCERVLTSGRPRSFEFESPRNNRWYEIRVTRITPTRLAHFFFDITGRKLAELHQAQLFDELNHRVKNNLAMVAGLLNMQARDATPEARDQLTRAADRVHSISEVHANLYKGGRRESIDFGAYLKDLCGGLADSLLDDGRLTLEVTTQSVEAPIDAAIPLGMIANELVTNAAKYAYPAPIGGIIRVTCERDAGSLILTVADQGRGMTEPQSTGGLGMRLIGAMAKQLGAELSVGQGPGVTFTLRLPLGA
jgi:two-component sensor histidine kinase